ncbi:MAG: peroxiredoxin [Phycisphaerae bacterium]|nr:peroxiredoxin [Phycisphaerae bacterium]
MEEAAASSSTLVGAKAPDVSRLDQDDRSVRLKDYRGRWVVLYFYPKDDTPGCTCEATEFTYLLERFHQAGADVLGVSPDTTGNHRFFREKYDLKVRLLSDTDRKLMRAYGAWIDGRIAGRTIGRVIRSTFLIDPAGKIAWHWPEVIPQGHAERVRQKLEQLQAEAAAAS